MRVLGKVIVNGEDANLEQIEAGMAWHYKKYQGEQSPSDRIVYSDAEREARMRKIGLWRDTNPISPWDYRQAERDRRKSMEPFVGKSTVRSIQ
jgi:endonuclease YncB( thermonuclease family)